MNDTAPVRLVPIPHGTRSGYCNHGCRCDDCREAHRIYAKEYRSRPEARHYARNEPKSRARALVKLAQAHPAEFAALLNNERGQLGLPPVGTDGRGPARYIEGES